MSSEQQTIQTGITAPPIGGWRSCEVCGESFQVVARRTAKGYRRDSTKRTCSADCHGQIVWSKRNRKTTEERYWSFVDKTPGQGPWGDCWGWKGSKSIGYGQFGNGDAKKFGQKPHRAHVYSYELHYGPVPEGLEVCHDCDNPPCSNPNHLIAGTTFENNHYGAIRRRIAAHETSIESVSADQAVTTLDSLEAQLDTPKLRRLLFAALNKLSYIQRLVIVMRFGLHEEDERTFEEIAPLLGFTRQRVQQLEASAMNRIRTTTGMGPTLCAAYYGHDMPSRRQNTGFGGTTKWQPNNSLS